MTPLQHLHDIDAIMSVNTKIEAAIRNSNSLNPCPRNLSFLTSVYSIYGELLPPNRKILSGVESIYSYWKGILDDGITETHLKTEELDLIDDTAIEVGSYIMKKGDVVADVGKYIVIWKNEYDEWKCHRNIWNSNLCLN